MSTIRKSKNLRLTPEDLDIIASLKRYSGVTSDNEVIRMALRAAQRELDRSTLSTQNKDSSFIPSPKG
jgi:hypothetical protein